MQKAKIKPHYCILALIAVIFALCCALVSACNADAEPTNTEQSLYEFERYDVEYDISSNCNIAVKEVITVHYLDDDSSAIKRIIPLDAGTQVKNLKVTGNTRVPYEVSIEKNYVLIDIGSAEDGADEYQTYSITYNYCIGNYNVNDGVLSLKPISFENDCQVKNATVKMTLPKGYVDAVRHEGNNAEADTDFETDKLADGRTVLTTYTTKALDSLEGISFDITFESGSLRAYFDITPYYFVIAAAVLLIILLILRFTVLNKLKIKPIVNFEAPEGMNPIVMGKLIDNKISAEDVTALIFYWADKGYIQIDLSDKDNPVLIKIKNLPATAEGYEKVVFAGLFKDGDQVKTGDLRNVFYRTYEKARNIINDSVNGLYTSRSIGISVLFALLGGLVLGLSTLVLGLTVSARFVYMYGFIAVIPALILYGFSESITYYRLKNTTARNTLYILLTTLGGLLCAGIFMLAVPSALIAIIPMFLIGVLSFAISAISVVLIRRTPEYNRNLCLIVGFKSFIKYAEKDKLEQLIKDDAQYYYHVLPYALVLKLDEVWEQRFKDLNVAPPAWATVSSATAYDFATLNKLLRLSLRRIARGMISRPLSEHN